MEEGEAKPHGQVDARTTQPRLSHGEQPIGAFSPSQHDGWHTEERSHHRKERGFWWASLIVTGIAAVGAGASAVLAWKAVSDGKDVIRQATRQAGAAEGQLSELQKQTAINASGFKPFVLPVIKGDKVNMTSKGASLNTPDFPFVSVLSFKNFGATPAIIKSIIVQFGLSLGTGYPNTEYHTTDLILEASGEHVISFDPPLFIPFVGQDYRRVVMGEIAIYLEGQVSYTDVTGALHLSQFCFRQNVSGRGGLRTDMQPASGPRCTNKID